MTPKPSLSRMEVFDPFGAGADPGLPSVASALDPATVRAEFKHRLPRLVCDGGWVRVRSILVTRHKPGKRCVIEYDVRIKHAELPTVKATLIGKIRARRFGNESYRLLDTLWQSGFHSGSEDGVCVPEPIAVLPRFQMWLQRKVPGSVASALIPGPDGIALVQRVAEAVHKLHRAGVPTDRRHTMADELRILHECLGVVSRSRPSWTDRINRVLQACDRLGSSVPEPKTCGIHRDFYPSQVIVDGPRIQLIDFDLYCQGDPALDAGNFIGHLTAASLRTLGDADAMKDREEAMEERFLELSGEVTRQAVRVYTMLTLVRHIYLSTLSEEGAPFAERFLDLCEERFLATGVF